MDTTYASQVAAQVAAAMVAKDVSQKALAEATDIPRVTLIRRLNGAQPFTVAELSRIAVALEVDVRSLIDVPGDAA